jgi:hypothetical protein
MVSKLGFLSGTSFLLSTKRYLGGRLVETPLLMQNLCLKLSLYFNRNYFTGTKMACKDDFWEGDYEEAKEQNGFRSSSLTIANKAQMMPSETVEVREPLFQTVGTFLKVLFYWRDFAKKRK